MQEQIDLFLLRAFTLNSLLLFLIQVPEHIRGLEALFLLEIFFRLLGIGNHFGNTTAFLSIMLGVLNLLPIPALDGGHAMFLVYEMVSGRKPSDKFMETVQVIGFIILLALVIFANGNDIYKLFNFIV